MKLIPKKIFGVLALLFLLSALAFSLFLYHLREGRFGGAFRFDPPSVFIENEAGISFFDEGVAISGNGKEMTLFLKNKEKEPLTFSFYQKGSLLGEKSLSSGEEGKIVLSSFEGSLSLLIGGEKTSAAFVCEKDSFLSAVEKMPRGGDVMLLEQTDLGVLSLKAPFRIFGAYTFREIGIEFENKGNIVISPDEETDGRLFVEAPLAKVYTENLSFPSETIHYYLKAKSHNGKRLFLLQYPVSDFEELSRLSNSNALPKLREDGVITIKKGFSMESSLAIFQHVSLVFEQKIDFENYVLSFQNEAAGEYGIKTLLGAAPSPASILFDAPESSLYWEGEGTVPVLATVEKYSNLAAFNGVPTLLGGKGKAMPTLTMLASENEFLEEDVVFSPAGNRLEGFLPYSVTEAKLSDALFHLSVSEGEVRLEGDLPYGQIVSVDANGEERVFSLEILREKYNIPVLYLETENHEAVTSKSQYLSATFTLDGEGTDIPSQAETHIRLRGRGNSTWKWEKKPLKIHFDEPTSILGLPAAEEWALFANYADKSLMRNRLAQKMAAELSFEYNPTQEYVDLFLNGEYLGVYTIGEHLEAGEGRIEVEHDMSEVDCGYFLEAGGVVSGVDVKGMNYFHAGLVKFVLVKGPEYNMLTSEQFDYIKNYMLRADAAVKNGEGYEEYLDMETLIDWLIMIEVSNNTDCAWRRSTYFTKNPGEKLKMGPVWDFDLAFGNFSKDVAGFNTWVSTSEDDYVGETWSTHFLEDPEFQQMFKARWNEVKDDLLAVALATIEEDYERLAPSAEENFQRWDILGRKVAFERHDTKNYKTYESQIQYLKDFLIDRFEWIDQSVKAW